MEKGLWNEYRKQYPYNPMSKFIQGGNEAMTNDADVSPLYTVTGSTPRSPGPLKTNNFLDQIYRNEYGQLAIHNQAGQYCFV